MRITATFSEGFAGALDGRAIGDEFEIQCLARIVGADEALIDITPHGAADTKVIQGELEVSLLISRPQVMT